MRAAVLGACVALASALCARDAWCAGALESIATELAKGMGESKGAALVVGAPLVSDVTPVKGDELALREAQLVAGAMGGAARAHAQVATLDQARTAAARAGALVFVQLTIAKGVVRATADVFPVPANPWDRVRAPVPPPRGHSFAQAAIDAEVRAFLPSIPLEHASVHKATHAEGDVLAAACGDLDGDGGLELALVSRSRVAIGHVVNGAFVPSRAAAWRALASRASVPMREPIGGASFRTAGEQTTLLVGTTDRGGVVLDESLSLAGAISGVPVAGGACVAPNPAASAFAGDALGCGAGAQSARIATALPPRFDALATGEIVSIDGAARDVSVARAPDGKLFARMGTAATTLDSVGAQIAVADLDQDGTPEIAASGNEQGGDDSIRVWTWDGAGEPRIRVTLAAPSGVRALCTCPPEDAGKPALVAIVGNEVWIVR